MCDAFLDDLRLHNDTHAHSKRRRRFNADERLPSSTLDICRYGHVSSGMARAATTTDAFNAIAEPKRREILDALAEGERPVNDLVEELGLTQPQVSKHLRVLREVGLVDSREDGRQRLYRLNSEPLKYVHDWVKRYERTWTQRFEALDEVLDELVKGERSDDDDDDERR
jgi:DNA-binding transcriptional ArsR family regulator